MRRPLLLASCLGAALLALYSCSMQASLTTDGEGRIVDVSSLRIGSTLSTWAIELLVGGGRSGFELRWIRPGGPRFCIECPTEQARRALSRPHVA